MWFVNWIKGVTGWGSTGGSTGGWPDNHYYNVPNTTPARPGYYRHYPNQTSPWENQPIGPAPKPATGDLDALFNQLSYDLGGWMPNGARWYGHIFHVLDALMNDRELFTGDKEAIDELMALLDKIAKIFSHEDMTDKFKLALKRARDGEKLMFYDYELLDKIKTAIEDMYERVQEMVKRSYSPYGDTGPVGRSGDAGELEWEITTTTNNNDNQITWANNDSSALQELQGMLTSERHKRVAMDTANVGLTIAEEDE
jgi:hypothetical protein